MNKSTFGERLLRAFGNVSHREIADILGVSRAAVGNYVDGRVPDVDKLLTIKKATKCSLDWLLSGEGQQFVAVDRSTGLEKIPALLRTIAEEQAQIVFDDAEIGGESLKARTQDLLTDLLISRALKALGLIAHETDLMSTADYKRAQKFTFVANAPQSLEDRIRELVSQTKNPATEFDKPEALRDMIRDIVREETGTSRKALVMPIEIHDQNKKTRKAG